MQQTLDAKAYNQNMTYFNSLLATLIIQKNSNKSANSKVFTNSGLLHLFDCNY